MTGPSRVTITPRMDEVLSEFKDLIRSRYPEATFEVGQGDDPVGIYLAATVDVENLYEVIDLYLDRLVDVQVDEDLPIFVVPRRTPERNEAIWARQGEPAATLVAV